MINGGCDVYRVGNRTTILKPEGKSKLKWALRFVFKELWLGIFYIFLGILGLIIFGVGAFYIWLDDRNDKERWRDAK